MLLTRENKDGFVYAYFDWDIVDTRGIPTDGGNYMVVKRIWVHKEYNGQQVIADFIKELDEDKRNKDVLWIYWEREKQGKQDRLSRAFRRSTALRRIQCLYSNA